MSISYIAVDVSGIKFLRQRPQSFLPESNRPPLGGREPIEVAQVWKVVFPCRPVRFRCNVDISCGLVLKEEAANRCRIHVARP